MNTDPKAFYTFSPVTDREDDPIRTWIREKLGENLLEVKGKFLHGKMITVFYKRENGEKKILQES